MGLTCGEWYRVLNETPFKWLHFEANILMLIHSVERIKRAFLMVGGAFFRRPSTSASLESGFGF